MARRLITLHGWGSPPEGYARLLHDRLQKLLGPIRLVELRYTDLTRWRALVPVLYHLTAAGARARATLARALEAARLSGDRTILVCHSYGCLVAWDVGTLPVDLWVTMDLPVSRFRSWMGAPTGMRTWLNLYSKRSLLGEAAAPVFLGARDIEVIVSRKRSLFGVREHIRFWESAKVASEIAFAFKGLTGEAPFRVRPAAPAPLAPAPHEAP